MHAAVVAPGTLSVAQQQNVVRDICSPPVSQQALSVQQVSSRLQHMLIWWPQTWWCCRCRALLACSCCLPCCSRAARWSTWQCSPAQTPSGGNRRPGQQSRQLLQGMGHTTPLSAGSQCMLWHRQAVHQDSQ